MKLARFLKITLTLLMAVISMDGCRKDYAESERCRLSPEVGPCKAAFVRYYYDRPEGLCKSFVWGGCNGVVPFETLEQCQQCGCRE